MEGNWLQELDESVGVDVLDGLLEELWWQAWCDLWDGGSGELGRVRSLSNKDVEDWLGHPMGIEMSRLDTYGTFAPS